MQRFIMVLVLVSVVLGVISFSVTQPNNDSISLKTPIENPRDTTSVQWTNDYYTGNQDNVIKLTNNSYTFFSGIVETYVCNESLTTCSLVK